VAISFVGSHVGSHAVASAQSIALSNLKNSAGATPTLLQGDLIVVTVLQAGVATRTQAQLLPTGYLASHAAVLTASDTNIASQQTSHKFMGATPDTTISIPAAASTTAGVAYEIHVFRGVDQTTPMDVTATTATGINTAQPNPPAITPITAGAWIYCVGGGAMAAGAAPQSAAPTGLDTTTNAWRQTVLTTTTNDPGIAAGFKSDWASGAFDCPALTGYTTTNTGAWCAATLALRPSIALQTLTWASGGSVNENSANGTAVGTVGNRTTGSTFSLADSASGRFAINSSTGAVTVADGSQLNYEAATSHSITVTETLAGATGSPKNTVLSVAVNDVAAPAATDWIGGTTPSIASNVSVGSAVHRLGAVRKSIRDLLLREDRTDTLIECMLRFYSTHMRSSLGVPNVSRA
jgi:hypothetical protein